ncbi:phosphoribosyl 1,2-cyclic phosphate phosphodiesterase [Breoghania corrubedonensis]|uniref:Phosphoribosyl 1,2-cyclic phosphate phosphodiesterase n=1 Tax=Breoghania corrubedonensis TaxID=665038 RepID=A0A2T5V921_9HYPH|nr:MBL fold metallo-hydrolase [Breoghania corrubedonensis]PTW60238.1 phosphoribosyl 1,2-cyclic phosphate phosphodiesterase [Breoghania corrubedonensis]
MTSHYRFTILGCGSSGGVPRIGNVWGDCDPEEPRNRRKRCSLLVERIADDGGLTQVLIDTGPDMRQQLLDADVGNLDAVLYTHAHADHIHGIDDLRQIAIHNRRRVPVFMDAMTSERARAAFGYCFSTPPGSGYPPILAEQRLKPGEAVTIEGEGGPITALPIEVNHGEIEALGFRIADVAYMPDVKAIPDESVPLLEGLDTWILDALRPKTHPSHFSLDDALGWFARMKPRRAIITNMHLDLDYCTLLANLPEGVEPAHDGMAIDVMAA